MAATQRLCFGSASLGPVENFRAGSSSRWSRLTARAAGNDRSSRDDSTSDESGSSNTQTDWDKAWSTYKNGAPKRPLFDLDMEKYVTRKPVHRNFSVSEEIDEFRKTERAALDAWTDPKFTYAGFSVIVGLFVYMVINSPLA